MVKIVCPGCGFRKEVKAGLVPEGAAITCPQCKERFFFTSGSSDEAVEDNTTGMHAGEKETPASEMPRPSYTPKKPTAPQSRFPAKAPAAKVGTGGDLPGIGELFSRTWEVYQERVWTLLGLYLTSLIATATSALVFIGAGLLVAKLAPAASTPLIMAGFLAGVTVGLFVLTWGFAALLIAVVDENAGFMESISRGKAKILPFAWLYTLMTLVIFGGCILLIIPGLVLSICFFFSQYILAEDDTRGLDALMKSKSYVKGYWWGIFFRLLAVWIVSIILNIIPFVGPFLVLAFTPFMYIYLNMNYRALKEIKGDLSPDTLVRGRQVMVALGVLGSIALVLIFAFALNEISKKAGSMEELQELLRGGRVNKQEAIHDEKPRLWLDKATYSPGEQMTVHFTAPASFEDNAWVGIFPADAPHGNEETNDQNKLIFQYLRKRTSGDLVFIGTTRPGSYDLRMNDTDTNGTEVYTVPFTVADPTAPPEQTAPPLPAR
jgi:hypothetical protein